MQVISIRLQYVVVLGSRPGSDISTADQCCAVVQCSAALAMTSTFMVVCYKCVCSQCVALVPHVALMLLPASASFYIDVQSSMFVTEQCLRMHV